MGILILLLGAAFAALLARGLWENRHFTVTEYEVSSPRLPEEFDGFTVAQISDLHNARFGEGNRRLISALDALHPDIIAITGDFVDSRRTRIPQALEFASAIVEIAPCYYVPGNHEARIKDYSTLKDGLLSRGISVVENSACEIRRGEARISLTGLADPTFVRGSSSLTVKSSMQTAVDNSQFTLLLSHRPEFFHICAANGADVVLTGHAHGGQFRLPKLGGLFAPGQGFLPKYQSGLYKEGRTAMVVSRGLGNSLFPFRLNNRPELVTVMIKTEHAADN